MSDFQYKSLLEQKKMAMNELQEYFRILRKVEFERQTLYDIKVRKRIYCLVRFLLKVNRLLEGRSIKVIGDEHYHTSRGKIYVCTTSSNFDVPNMVEVINELSWTVISERKFGDFNKSLELLLRTNLLTLDDNLDEEDLKVIENRLYKNLSTGGSEICFPENVGLRSDKEIVGLLDGEFVKRLIETRSMVIPVALSENTGRKETLINIGKNIDFGHVDSSFYEEVRGIVRTDLIALKDEISFNEKKRFVKKLF